MATRYLLYSHDGFGLGHTRRNLLIARAVLKADPGAEVTLITGVAARPGWLGSTRRLRVVRVPPLLKDAGGAYRGGAIPFEEAVAVRAGRFRGEVVAGRPHVVVVDRHPGGTAGELRTGLERARDQGAALVLGLRDVLDEPRIVAAELAGEGWRDVPELFTEVLVYGARHFVDHEREYGLPVRPHYCGWVVPQALPIHRQRWSLVVAAGGGGDGGPVFDLGAGLLAGRPGWSGLFAAGPYADHRSVALASRRLGPRLTVLESATGCEALFARAGAVLCMAGYNSTLEALATGRRPILVLDEPTTGLDAHSEGRVLRGLAALVRGRTTIVISHSAALASSADRVAVMERGRVVEEGSPAELLGRPSGFRRLVHEQAWTRYAGMRGGRQAVGLPRRQAPERWS